MEKQVIMYQSHEAATYKTNIEGWVSSDGRYWGKGDHNEHMARYTGCTHTKCDCGAIIPNKSYTKCYDCRNINRIENYNKLPFKIYNGDPVVTAFESDNYFFDEDSIIDYMNDNDMKSIDLLFCEPNTWFKIENDYWADIMPENSEGDLPEDLQNALNNLNDVIKKLPPCSYSPGKIRTSYILK